MSMVRRFEPFAIDDHASFARIVLAGDVAYLVVFGLPWSATDRSMAERVARVAARHAIAAVAIDADASAELARQYAVTAVPSLLLFRHGQVVGRRIGELAESDLDDWITRTLAED
jgi:thioredoxin-like negative regulator of GroEL